MSKKYVTLFVTIFCIGMLIAGSTYAYWTWTSNTNKNIVFSTASGLEDYVIYDEGNSHFVGDFQPSDKYCGGISSTIAFSKTSEASNTSLVATINMDINKIEHNISSSDHVKWAVTYGDNNIDCSGEVPTVLQSGSFKGLTSGQTITLMSDIELKKYLKDNNGVSKEMADSLLDKSNANYNDNLSNFRQNANSNYNMFTVWIWIDSSGSGLSNLSGETLDTNIWTQIDMKESNTLRPGDSGIVNFDSNCGNDICEGVPMSQIKVHGEDLTLSSSIPTRVGYTFAGWSTDKNDFSIEYNAGDVYKLEFKNMTLYAVWTPLTYIVTLNGNGATNNDYTKNLTVAYQSSSIVPKQIRLPEKEYTVNFATSDAMNSTDAIIKNSAGEIIDISNYTDSYKMQFDGWANSSGKIVVNNQESLSFLSNVNGYTNQNSQWIQNAGATLDAQWSAGKGILLPTITKSGYICGWNANSSATSIAHFSGREYKPTDNRTLYGICLQNIYTVIANVCDGATIIDAPGWIVDPDFTSASKNVTVNNKIGTLPTVYRSGYDSDKWTLKNGTEITSSTVLTEDLIGDDGVLEIDANCSITPNKVTVKFNVNGGNIKTPTTYDGITYNWTTTDVGTIMRNGDYQFFTIGYGQSKNLPNPDGTYMNVTRTGYSPANGAEWICLRGDCVKDTVYSDTDDISASDLCDASDGDCEVTLGVNWKANGYDITFDYNANYFNSLNNISSTNSSIVSYDKSTSYLTLNGTPTIDTGNGIELMLSPMDFTEGDKYKVETSIVSGTTGLNLDSFKIHTDIMSSESLSIENRIRNVINSFPSESELITIDSNLATNGKYLRVKLWFSDGVVPKFTNTVLKVKVTKIDVIEIDYDDNYILPVNAKRIGYTFDGWYTAESGGTQVTTSEKVTIPEAHTLYAHWTSEFDVHIRFKPNGGTVEQYTGSNSENYWTIDSGFISLSKNGAATDNVLMKIDYDGKLGDSGLLNVQSDSYLYITPPIGHKITNEWECIYGCTEGGRIFDNSTRYEASDFCDASDNHCDVILQPVWDKNEVKILFSANGGTVTSSTNSSDGSKTYKWSVDSSDYNKIYLSVNGGTSTSLSMTVKYGESLSSSGLVNLNNSNYLKITAPSNKTGILHEEWLCKSTCTEQNKIFDQSETYEASDFCDASYGDCNVLLYANWLSKYKVTYDLNGGEISTFHVKDGVGIGGWIFNTLDAKYKFEVWGAQGGLANELRGGYGGYSTGLYDAALNEELHVNIGGQGGAGKATANYTAPGGSNGGGVGKVGSNAYYVAGGGGATHIATEPGVLSTFSSSSTDLKKILIVAGGGGGSAYNTSSYRTTKYGDGGGYVGVTAQGTGSSENGVASGGKQSEIGAYGTGAGFGYGANGASSSQPGGGGGLYGGNTDSYSAGGGSGYIGNSLLLGNTSQKYMFCANCNTSTTAKTYTRTNAEDADADTYISGYPYTKTDGKPYVKKGDGAAKITIDESTIAKKEVTYSKQYGSLPTPSRYSFTTTNGPKGYKFLGWYTAASGGTKVTESSVVNTNSNHTLYAHWQEIDLVKQYPISFDGNGTTASPAYDVPGTIVKSHGKKIYLPTQIPKRDGYKFLGWAISKSATDNLKSAGDEYTTNKSIILYAIWEETYVTIRYNVGTSGSLTSKTTNSSGTTTYTWTKDDDGTIKRNNVYGFFTVKYGESVDLVNYNNENYLLIKRSGYKGRDGAEWKCKSGCSRTFNQDTSYSTSKFCNAKHDNCVVELEVNWVESTPPSCSISANKTTLTASFKDTVGVVGTYFGTTKPTTSTTFEPISSTTSGTTTGKVAAAKNHYFGFIDAAGNVGYCTAVIKETNSKSVNCKSKKVAGGSCTCGRAYEGITYDCTCTTGGASCSGGTLQSNSCTVSTKQYDCDIEYSCSSGYTKLSKKYCLKD